MLKTIFITGSSTGLGRPIAFEVASRGWNVLATMRDPSAPGVQIRLARFDSGPRLQPTRITESSVVRFFSCAHSSTQAAHSLQGSALAAGCCKGEGVAPYRAAGLGR